MKLGRIFRSGDNGVCLIPRVFLAVKGTDRTRGLIGRPRLEPGEGLLIDRCAMIHTFGMAYPLDLAFIGRAGDIKKTVHALVPYRLAGSLTACMTLELPSGSLDSYGLTMGEHVVWRESA